MNSTYSQRELQGLTTSQIRLIIQISAGQPRPAAPDGHTGILAHSYWISLSTHPLRYHRRGNGLPLTGQELTEKKASSSAHSQTCLPCVNHFHSSTTPLLMQPHSCKHGEYIIHFVHAHFHVLLTILHPK